jgi:excisionase family DNA binding protein
MTTAPMTFLKPIEAADALRISYSTLRQMLKTGELRSVRIGPGRSIRIPTSELERLAAPARRERAAVGPGVRGGPNSWTASALRPLRPSNERT